jgi:CxxC-x17-CxxC domain-containing protein
MLDEWFDLLASFERVGVQPGRANRNCHDRLRHTQRRAPNLFPFGGPSWYHCPVPHSRAAPTAPERLFPPGSGEANMGFQDRILKCSDCGADFVFTAGEQLFFREKHFENDPKHCKQCRAKRAGGNARIRTETLTTCSECGAETTVSFKPTQGRPVLCRSCFQNQQGKLRVFAKPIEPAS